MFNEIMKWKVGVNGQEYISAIKWINPGVKKSEVKKVEHEQQTSLH